MPVVLLCCGKSELDPKGIQVLSAQQEYESESMSDRICITGQQMTMATTGTELLFVKNNIMLNLIETCIDNREKNKTHALF